MFENRERSQILFEQNVGSVFGKWPNKNDEDLFRLILNQAKGILGALFDSYSMEEPIVDILDVKEINAYAIKRNGHSFIALTPGIINSIRLHNRKILATKNLQHTYKIDESDLSRLSIIFLVGHEAGHLVLGHLDSAIQNLRAEFSLPTSTQPEVDSVVEEVAADRFGAEFLFNYLNSLHLDFNRTDVIFFSLMAILSVFRVLGGGGKWMDRFFDSTHPPSEYRSIAACSQFLTSLQLQGKIDAENIKNVASNAFELEHKAYFEANGEEISAEQREQYGKLLKIEKDITKFVIEHHHSLHPTKKIK